MIDQPLTPIGIVDRDGELWVEWADLTGIVPDEPFFDQTIQRCLADPTRAASRRATPLASLPTEVQGSAANALRPSGFVFHTSRCGSTLVARMLRATGSTLVLSEPAPLDAVLRPGGDGPSARAERVRAMVTALGHARAADHRHYVIKFDAWAVFDLALIRRAFPLVPWVFLYREPADTLASQLRRPGSHVVPGFVRDLSLAEAVAMGREDHCALVLSSLAAAAARHGDDPLARFIRYSDLPGAVAAQIAPHFGIDVSPAGRAAMADVARWDSRTPSLPFLRARAEPTPATVRAVRAMEPAYAALDALAHEHRDASAASETRPSERAPTTRAARSGRDAARTACTGTAAPGSSRPIRAGGLPDRVRLPMRFDAGGIRADAEALASTAWLPHFNSGVYEGDWSGVALRSVGGSTSLYPDPAAPEPFADTDLLRACPHVARALTRLACPLQGVRLLRLGPGAAIASHRDYRLGFADGEVRLHVPVLTSELVSFVLDGEPVVMDEGECWYLDLNLPHEARNDAAGPRIHLVIDCIVDEWLTDLLVGSAPANDASSSALIGAT